MDIYITSKKKKISSVKKEKKKHIGDTSPAITTMNCGSYQKETFLFPI